MLPTCPAVIRRPVANSPPSALHAETIRCISRFVNVPSTGSERVSSAARSVSGKLYVPDGTRAAGATGVFTGTRHSTPLARTARRRRRGPDARCRDPYDVLLVGVSVAADGRAYAPEPPRRDRRPFHTLRDVVVRRLGLALFQDQHFMPPAPAPATADHVGGPPEAVHDNEAPPSGEL